MVNFVPLNFVRDIRLALVEHHRSAMSSRPNGERAKRVEWWAGEGSNVDT
jgi:hypothetical protein